MMNFDSAGLSVIDKMFWAQVVLALKHRSLHNTRDGLYLGHKEQDDVKEIQQTVKKDEVDIKSWPFAETAG